MIVVGLVPVLLGAVSAVLAPTMAARLPPRTAAAALTALCLVVGLATGAVLTLLAVPGIATTFPALAPADWSTGVLRRDAPLPAYVGLAAAVVVLTLVANALRHAVAVFGQLRTAYRTAARLPSVDGLAIAADDAAYAYAVPGRPGRVVVSTGLLHLLAPEQRRAVLAHERSHLRHGHAGYLQLARLAAAANPLLRPVAGAVDAALERWADADAAAAVGDPRTVAHAIGIAALRARPSPAGTLGAGDNGVVQRVRFLLEPARVQHRWNALLLVIGGACCVATTVVALDVHAVVEAAEALH